MSKKEVLRLDAGLLCAASVVGGKEAEGPLGAGFDLHDPEDRFGQKTWEAAESEMQRMALGVALAKAGRREEELGAILAGDLLNQCVGSAYGLLTYDVPYFGLYGACSTSAEALLLSSVMVTHGVYELCATVTSSHYCAAERQYRTPLEYGGQRPPTAQWTVTGAGAFLVCEAKKNGSFSGPRIRRGLPGRAIERGLTDANNMGAAMAPAALDTLKRFFLETGERPDAYDLILTGDLGFEGGAILCELAEAEGLSIRSNYDDCGRRIYRREGQDVHGGGSGCGCSAVVLAADILPRLQKGELGRMLFLATGAMMSPDSIKQGNAIPAIAHLLEIEGAMRQKNEQDEQIKEKRCGA